MEISGAHTDARLSLWFTSKDSNLALTKTHFTAKILPEPVIGIRGKAGRAYATGATFQWTSSVQVLSILLMKAVTCFYDNVKIKGPLLEGHKGSMASSLDAAMYKNSDWLDLFGASINGNSLCQRLFPRTNPGRRRPGPVMISLNEKLLPASAIDIYVDDQRVQDPTTLKYFIKTIEDTWSAEHEPVQAAAA